MKELGVAAGIDVFENPDGSANSKLNHQVLRRTTATHFQKHGQIKDTQALLRHTKASTTLEHYQKRLDQSLITGVDQWDAELIPRKGPEKISDISKGRKRVHSCFRHPVGTLPFVRLRFDAFLRITYPCPIHAPTLCSGRKLLKMVGAAGLEPATSCV